MSTINFGGITFTKTKVGIGSEFTYNYAVFSNGKNHFFQAFGGNEHYYNSYLLADGLLPMIDANKITINNIIGNSSDGSATLEYKTLFELTEVTDDIIGEPPADNITLEHKTLYELTESLEDKVDTTDFDEAIMNHDNRIIELEGNSGDSAETDARIASLESTVETLLRRIAVLEQQQQSRNYNGMIPPF